MGKYKILFLLVLVLVLTRVGAALFFIDALSWPDELHHGMIAKEVMEGPSLPLYEYPIEYYAQGGLLTSILTIPYFFLFGKNFFALKMTPIAFSVVILVALFLFAYKYFNRRVAVITGLLYLFSSSVWTRFNLHNGGLHFENIIFVVSAMYLFYEVIFNGKDKPGYYLFLGVLSGFGTYWIYTFLVTHAAILLLWFLRDKKMFMKKGIYLFFAGFFIGMLPRLYYNIFTEFKSLEILYRGISGQDHHAFIMAWPQRFLKSACFPKMLSFNVRDNIYGPVYFSAYCLSFLFILRLYKFSLKKIIFSKESFVLIYPVVLLLIVSAYGADIADGGEYINWRYVVSIFPFIFLTIAIVIDRFMVKFKALKAVFLAILSLLIIAEGAVYSQKIDFKEFGSGFKQPGYSYIFVNDSFQYKYSQDFYKILDFTTSFPAPQKYEILTMNTVLNHQGKIRQVDFKEYLKLSARIDERYKPIFYKVLINGLFLGSDLPVKDLIGKVDILSKQVDDRYKPYLYQGIGAIMVARSPGDTRGYKDGAVFLDEKYKAYYYQGLSESVYAENVADYVERFKSCMGWLDKQYRPFYLESIGETLAKIGYCYTLFKVAPNAAALCYDILNNLEPVYKIYVLEGIGKGSAYLYGHNTKDYIHEFIRNNLKEEDTKAILKAMTDNLSVPL